MMINYIKELQDPLFNNLKIIITNTDKIQESNKQLLIVKRTI